MPDCFPSNHRSGPYISYHSSFIYLLKYQTIGFCERYIASHCCSCYYPSIVVPSYTWNFSFICSRHHRWQAASCVKWDFFLCSTNCHITSANKRYRSSCWRSDHCVTGCRWVLLHLPDTHWNWMCPRRDRSNTFPLLNCWSEHLLCLHFNVSIRGPRPHTNHPFPAMLRA